MATKKTRQAWKSAAKKAVKEAGGAYKVAAAMDLWPWAIYKWERVPAERVLTMEKLCGGKVRREQMRPDLYPPEDAKSVA